MKCNNQYIEIRTDDRFIRMDLDFKDTEDNLEGRDRAFIYFKVTVDAGVFKGDYDTEAEVWDFQQLKQQLQNIYENLNGGAYFKPLENGLSLDIKGDGLGHLELHCIANPSFLNPALDQKLSFDLQFDQTFIPRLVRQIEQFIK